MLTLFTIPKAFQGDTAIIQRNAIHSWIRLHPDCEIILCGDDDGVREAASKFRTRHIPYVTRNEFGTPLVDSVFENVEREARYPLLCYVNADIILMKDLISAVKSIRFHKFLMVGQRWDIDLVEPINFEKDGWEDCLWEHVDRNGSLQPPDGIDYFVFPRETIGILPPFAVGRPGWDNWLIYRARALGISVIDATGVVTAIHQNHDYAHVKHGVNGTWEGPEARRNREIVGGWEYFFTIRDATHYFASSRSASLGGPIFVRRRLGTLPVPALKATKRLAYFVGAGTRVLKRRLSS